MSAAPKAAMSAKPAGWLYTSPSGRTQHAAPIEDREQGLCDEGWTETPLYSADTIAALRKDAERREGVVATLQETCEIYERRLSASEPVAALATRLSAARAAHNDLLCDPKATTVQFIGSRDRLLFTWAALDSAIAAKGK